MEAALNQVPTLREELDRKVMDTLEWVIGGREKGKLTSEEASVALDALFMAVSGLVDNDFIHIITGAQDMIGGDKPAAKRHFILPAEDMIRTVSWVPCTSKLTICQRQGGYATGGTVKEFDSEAAAGRAFVDLGKALEKRGWEEL